MFSRIFSVKENNESTITPIALQEGNAALSAREAR